ncbi:ATP-binding protein [Streptomyces sp. JH34]|uniref:ATP-binding protein n=1 Tax=Streptomyces sp. JH34 TaxID=2793633 RepID=UPI0023F92462|nr:ATP-binding protein [Streptomyces sp. JH34]MDF6020828.1 ATP-binding protein [Streptomyces sp. JH34]
MSAPDNQTAAGFHVFAQRFSATRRGARLARLLSALQLVEWGHPRGTGEHDTATIVVAELAANAVSHGRVPGRDFALLLMHDSHRGVIRIEVSDTHPGRPALLTPSPETVSGRGLVIVDAVATRWGVRERVGPGKTVWAECALSAAPTTPACGTIAARSASRHHTVGL